MKIYVAASSAELERARAAMDWCREQGFEITHDWVADVTLVRLEGGKADADLTPAEQLAFVVKDLDAVGEADLLWFLVPRPPATTVGAWVELGAAYELGRPVIVSGPHAAQMFCSAASQAFTSDFDARHYLVVKFGGDYG